MGPKLYAAIKTHGKFYLSICVICGLPACGLQLPAAFSAGNEPETAQKVPSVSQPVRPKGSEFSQLLTYATTAAPDVRRARAELAAAKAALQSAKGALGPALTGQAETFQSGDLPSTAAVELRQPLWHGGRNRLNISRMKLQSELAEIQLRAAQELSGHKFIDYFFQWSAADTEAQIRQTYLAQVQDVLADIRSEYENGLVGASEYTGAQIEVDQMQRRLLTVESARENAHVALESFLQSSQDGVALRKGAPKDRHAPARSALNTMIEQSPFVLSADKKVALAKLDIDLHNAGKLPAVDAVARREWTEIGTAASGLGIMVHMTFQNPSITKARANELKNSYTAAQAAVDVAKTDLQTRILQAERALGSSLSRIDTLSQILQRAQEALDSAKRQKAAGTGSWETVIASINELAELRVALAEAKSNKATAINHLALYSKGIK